MLADEIGEPGHAVGIRDLQPGTEVIPERNGELGAGFQEAEEGVARLLAGRGAGLAGDPAFGDEAADGVLRTVGVQRDVWPVEDPQQLVLVGVGPGSSSSTKPVTRVKIRSNRCLSAVRWVAVGSSL